VTISPDAKSAAKAAGNEEPTKSVDRSSSTYEVTVKPDVSTLSNGKTKCPIQPGMEGRVDIISQEESVMEFMLKKARLLVTI
jgi:multidrug efflux pump subunit AcrA (membrane-fusion protein)